MVVFVLLGLGALLLWRTHALLYLAIAVLVGRLPVPSPLSRCCCVPITCSQEGCEIDGLWHAGDGAVLLHAVFRAPNLKARMASARQEFRAVWRGYQSDISHDYTL